MQVSELKLGESYVFHLKPFQPPVGDALPVEAKSRKFVGVENVGAVGKPSEPFVEVERVNGSRHLIAVESIEAIEPV
ncbi:hypothetical protein [Paraburkholderia tropica]|uniref:hypothetical protein n=1 Tax=Paraburkholderia tropica TaxID=92647 RepID=UPI002AB5EF9C|nr:hypothetical protein [Paraburkholderia tropica]